MGERHTEEMRLLGLTIAFYRRARGLTQSELAEAVQISRTLVCQDYPGEAPGRTA